MEFGLLIKGFIILQVSVAWLNGLTFRGSKVKKIGIEFWGLEKKIA